VATSERIRMAARNPALVAGAVVILVWIACALFAGHLAPHDPKQPDIVRKFLGPSASHPFGTDSLGRDILSRVIFGARDVLTIAPLATLLGTVLGTAIGLAAGSLGGLVDDALMRFTDAFLALPAIIVAAVVIAALDPSPSQTIEVIILVIGLLFTPIIARTVRAAVLGEAHLEYVQAARLRRERAPHVMAVEILPNVMGPVLVEFTVRLGYAVFTVQTLSFLGVGIAPGTPDWGLDVSDHYTFLSAGFWWPVLFPALAIASLVVAVNLVADGLNRAVER
jgi:peptide/nickel transport system permease protein